MSEYGRRFVSPKTDLGDWEQIRPLFDALEKRPLHSTIELERWLEDASELMACLSEEETRRYVAMTCQTDDEQRRQRYLEFVEQIKPRCKPRWHDLQRKYAGCTVREGLDRWRYEVLDRSILNQVELFREENVPLETRDETLRSDYQKIVGAMTVVYEGREQTLQQMARYQLETDRQVRQETWELTVRRRLDDADRLDDLFDEMVRLRHEIARNAGFANYRDYMFRARERFDYSPEDCLRFHEAIEREVVPIMRQRQQERAERLGVDVLRPWDLAVDLRGRPPLRPFETVERLCEGCTRIFYRVHEDFGRTFEMMREKGWLDLESRKGKAPGGYQATFDESRHPFIFMNAVGLHRDVETLLHEGGHAFHAMACRDEPLVQYRHAPTEFAEVASMGMELLSRDHLDEFYSGEDLRRAWEEQLEGIVRMLPWVATIDAFQHWLYTHPDHTREQRNETWERLLERFGGIEDYRGWEDARRRMWQRQLHLYEVPFYYIEYGIAQLGALQVWRAAQQGYREAVESYRRALRLGGARPLPELFEVAGVQFDFSQRALAPVMEHVAHELAALSRA